MQDTALPPIAIPAPIVIPSAPIPPQPRLSLQNVPSPLASEYVSDISLEPPNKKRKKDRACDYCRRRKIKCDGPWVRGHVCTNCIHGHRTCTYVESSRPRGPSKAYVVALEDRMEQLEGVISQLCPDTDFSEELGPPVIRGSWRDDYTPTNYHLPPSSSTPFGSSPTPLAPLSTIPKSNTSLVTGASSPTLPVNRTSHLIFKPPRNASRQSIHMFGSSSSGSSSDDSSSDSSEETLETWAGGRQKFTLSALESVDQTRGNSIRFHGRSSTASLVEVTRKFKHLCMQERYQGDSRLQEEYVEAGEAGGLLGPENKSLNTPDNEKVRATRRARFWSTPKWELAWEGHSAEVPHVIQSVLGYFPSSRVAARLIDLFFRHTNTYLPLLHRPTFDRLWHRELHRRNIWFSTVCILMFAIASRWYEGDESDDNYSPPRQIGWKGIGWRWFFVVLDVHRTQRSLFCPANLFEVQTFTLMAMFLRGTTCGPIGWLFTSIGIRKAQDRGAHRRKVYKSSPNADDELWKRAFWVLLTLDRITGASLGRGTTVGEEDYDLDLPLEVDDEYWDMGGPEADFKQPLGKPSRMAYFIQFIKLAKIIGFTAKTLYPIDKSKVFSGLIKDDWTQEAVQQLKLAMEEWVENVPNHLRWSEDIEDPIFASQSATIHSLYHCVQMTIWRQFCVFNPSTVPGKGRKESFSAMGICAISVRAAARILDVQMRTGISNIPTMINVALVCAGTMAMILWELRRKMVSNGKKSAQIRAVEIEGTGIHVHELLDDTGTCVQMLESTKPRWEWAETVLENLKDALPSDGDENLENLDITERFQKVNGMSHIVNLPVDFNEHGNVVNPRVFEDGSIPFSEQDFRQINGFPTMTSASSSEDYRSGISSAQTLNPLSTNLGVHARGRLSQTSDTSHCESPTKDTKIPKGSVQLCGPKSQIQTIQPSQRPRSHLFPIPTLVSTNRHPPVAEQAQNVMRAPPIYQSPFGGVVPPVSGLEPILPHPFQMTPISNASFGGGLPQVQVPQESGPYSEAPAVLQWPISSDREQTTPQSRQARARAVSLLPAGCKRTVPFISNSLRRTSFPDLQTRRESDRVIQRESDATALRHQDEVKHIFPLSREDDRGTLPENPQVNHHRLTRGEPKVMGWSGDVTDTVLDRGGGTESKLIRSTEFRHWNKYPLPPKRLGTDLGPTQNTQHRFVHEHPYSR